jgi:hypothetical protein
MPHHQNLLKLRKELGGVGDRIGLSINNTCNTYTVSLDSKYYHLKPRLYLDEDIRITKGHRGTLVVVDRM